MSLLNLKIQQKKFKPTFSVRTFFRAYLLALKTRALFFNYLCPASKKISDFLMYLEKNAQIAGYKFFPQTQEFKIFLNYDRNQKKPYIPKILYYSLQGRTRSVSLTQLKQFGLHNSKAVILIQTHRGIMDLKTCLINKLGGQVLVTIL